MWDTILCCGKFPILGYYLVAVVQRGVICAVLYSASDKYRKNRNFKCKVYVSLMSKNYNEIIIMYNCKIVVIIQQIVFHVAIPERCPIIRPNLISIRRKHYSRQQITQKRIDVETRSQQLTPEVHHTTNTENYSYNLEDIVRTSKTGNRKHCERRERSMEGPLKTTLSRLLHVSGGLCYQQFC